MTADGRQRIEALFHAALERPRGEWDAFLADACEDPELSGSVRALLDGDEAAEAWFADLADRAGALEAASDPRPEANALAGRRFGAYLLETEIGRGGTSVVYAGRRTEGPLERIVAVKVLARRSAGPDLRARFAREQQVLSGLNHPNIAAIYDGGVTDDGYPYFVMEMVDGSPLDRYCDEQRLSVGERLRIFLTVVDAVQHAHRSLVIHRDLKPSNILVTADGTPKLIDFGIARVLSDGSSGVEVATTRLIARWMTPQYAAPEQVRGERTTTATDVYQLGVVLYELLTGLHPMPREASGSPYLSGKAICETEPRRPSLAVGDAAQLRNSLRGDLDAIVLRALQKEPSRRYGSADGLARDIRRYLAGEPVEAREGTLRYRIGKLAGRHRAAVAASAAGLLVLIGGAALHTVRLAEQRNIAQVEMVKAQTVTEFMLDLFEATHPEERRGGAPTAAMLLERGVERADRLADQPIVQAEMLATIARAYHGLADHERAAGLYTRALEIRRAELGRDHPDVAHALAHIGWSRLMQSDFPAAAGLFREAAAIQRVALGPRHPEVANSVHGLGLAVNGLGHLESALELLEEAQAIRRAAYGDAPHVEIANGLNDLAILLRTRGDLAAAERHLVEALSMRRSILPEGHPDIGKGAQHLGSLLHRMGDYAGAEPLYLEALAIWRQSLGPDHPSTLSTVRSLASLYGEWERPADALPYTALLAGRDRR